MIKHIGETVTPLSVNLQCCCVKEHPGFRSLLPVAPFFDQLMLAQLDLVGPENFGRHWVCDDDVPQVCWFPGVEDNEVHPLLAGWVHAIVTSTLAVRPQLRAISARQANMRS